MKTEQGLEDRYMWKFSHYTAVIREESGSFLLHNSFMGAVASIPFHQAQKIEQFLREGIKTSDLTDPTLKELCQGGFFVPSDLDEQGLVTTIIDKERESGFGVIILPHENCNFRCTYCYETFERGKMIPDVIAGLKIFVGRKIEEVKHLSISWFGGEPLLAKDVIYDLSDSFMENCRRHNVLYASSMTTNGYFLTPDVVDQLLVRKVKHFQVTIDGPEAIHDRSRKLVGGGRNLLENHEQSNCDE